MRSSNYKYFINAEAEDSGFESSLMRTPFYGEWDVWEADQNFWAHYDYRSPIKDLNNLYDKEISERYARHLFPNAFIPPLVDPKSIKRDSTGRELVNQSEFNSMFGSSGDYGLAPAEHQQFWSFYSQEDWVTKENLCQYLEAKHLGVAIDPICASKPEKMIDFCCQSESRSWCLNSDLKLKLITLLSKLGYQDRSVKESEIWFALGASPCLLKNYHIFSYALFELVQERRIDFDQDFSGERCFEKSSYVAPKLGRPKKYY